MTNGKASVCMLINETPYNVPEFILVERAKSRFGDYSSIFFICSRSTPTSTHILPHTIPAFLNIVNTEGF